MKLWAYLLLTGAMTVWFGDSYFGKPVEEGMPDGCLDFGGSKSKDLSLWRSLEKFESVISLRHHLWIIDAACLCFICLQIRYTFQYRYMMLALLFIRSKNFDTFLL